MSVREQEYIFGVRQMKQGIIERLFRSFSDLESSILSAKEVLESKGLATPDVMERIGSYDEILRKQRNLALNLAEHMERGNWDEVNRHVTLINSLSNLIRDDARAILSSMSLNTDTEREAEKLHIC